MSAALEWLKTSFKDVKHEVFKDIEKIKDAVIKPMGDGQVVIISDINRVTLVIETSKGEERTVKAIAKLEALTGSGRDLAASWGAFKTEIIMYSEVLKTMEKLMLEVGDRDTLWAECYHCRDNRLLFQDLCEDGYRVVPVHNFLNIEHALLVMKNIGKFHALTMVMKERSILKFHDSSKPYYAQKLPFFEKVVLNSLNMLAKVIREGWGPEWSTVPDRILKYLEHPSDKLYDVWKSCKGKWEVLNHGDFSMRNMLFHYPEGSDHPDGIKFVDYQLSHYSGLGNDLVTLLYSSIKPQEREQNWKLLLSTYVNSLSATAAVYNYKGPLPTFEDVETCIESLHPVIFITFMVNLPFFIGAGKQDVQKKSDEYFRQFENCKDMANSPGPELGLFNSFLDEDVASFIKFELQTCIKKQMF